MKKEKMDLKKTINKGRKFPMWIISLYVIFLIFLFFISILKAVQFLSSISSGVVTEKIGTGAFGMGEVAGEIFFILFIGFWSYKGILWHKHYKEAYLKQLKEEKKGKK